MYLPDQRVYCISGPQIELTRKQRAAVDTLSFVRGEFRINKGYDKRVARFQMKKLDPFKDQLNRLQFEKIHTYFDRSEKYLVTVAYFPSSNAGYRFVHKSTQYPVGLFGWSELPAMYESSGRSYLLADAGFIKYYTKLDSQK